MNWITIAALAAAFFSCQTVKDSSSLSSEDQADDFKCQEIAGQWSLTGTKGDVLTVVETYPLCEEIRTHIANNLLCIQMGDSWTVSSIPDSTTLIFELTKEQCFESIASSKHKVVCTPVGSGGDKWKPTHRITGEQFGRYPTPFEDCTFLTSHAGPNVVCTNTGVFNQRGRKPTRVHTGKYTDEDLMGSSGQQEFCAKSTEASLDGWVCVCNGNNCSSSGWLMKNIQNKKTYGTTTLLSECIKQNPK